MVAATDSIEISEPEPELSSRISLRADGGMAYTMPTEITMGPAGVSGVDVDFDTGFRFDVAGQYRLTDWVAFELEGGWIFNQIVSGSDSVMLDGSLSQVPFYGNVILQYPGLKRWRPFIGGGVGGALMSVDFEEFQTAATSIEGTDSTFVFAYQVLAGLGFQLNETSTLGLMYRFSGTADPEWDSGVNLVMEGLTTHSGTLTFSVRF